jgi:hypothetical protein
MTNIWGLKKEIEKIKWGIKQEMSKPRNQQDYNRIKQMNYNKAKIKQEIQKMKDARGKK